MPSADKMQRMKGAHGRERRGGHEACGRSLGTEISLRIGLGECVKCTGGDSALAQESNQRLAALLERLCCIHCGTKWREEWREAGSAVTDAQSQMSGSTMDDCHGAR